MEDAMLKKTELRKRKNLPVQRGRYQNRTQKPLHNDLTEIVMITTYPPRECGIATFSSDLQKALKDKYGDSLRLSICSLDTDNEKHTTADAPYRLNTDTPLDYLRISRQINDNSNCGLVLIQHEFGLFSQNEESFHRFLEFIDRPIVFTFHTVLPEPDASIKKNVTWMASVAKGIIVMTKTSAEILQRDYGVSADLITVIPHGTHLVPYENKDTLKEKYGLTGKKVLSTFGLLGPGKNIETTLDALPSIIEKDPETIFLIIGRTHPTLVKEVGEDYREFLKQKIGTLGLGDHVRFVNEFVPLNALLEYLQLTDIYLFTSKDPNQAVSGTFSYALSCGCPIVSTPIPHALEVLENEAGALIDFEAPDQLAETVIDLLENGEVRRKMSLNGLHSTAESAWENAAIAHARLFERVCDKSLRLSYERPELKLDHLKKMTTKTGIIQFSRVNHPDISSGYTLDDNARALIAVCRHFELTGQKSDLELIHRYYTFIKNCLRPDDRFLNYVDEMHRFTPQNDEVNLEDANGRALWALGYLVSLSHRLPFGSDVVFRNVESIFRQGLAAMEEYRSPRAMAFILKGLYYFTRQHSDEKDIETAEHYGERLVASYRKLADADWRWFENYLTYGNSVLPQGLLMAYQMTGNEGFRAVAKESFDFLLSKIFKGNSIQVVSNIDWLKKNAVPSSEFQGGEQPIDVAYTILALKKFHEVFPEAGYDVKMAGAFDWFMGDNPLNQIIYNPCTGGCYDGLEKHNVNLNQGAESTISYLLARMAFEEEVL